MSEASEEFEARKNVAKLQSDEDVVREINKNNEFKAVYNSSGNVTKKTVDSNTVYWKPMKIRLKDGNLRRISATLRRIKNIIGKIKTFVNLVRQFSKLLERLEQAITSPLNALIETLQKRLLAAIREVGASGVYVLSTHEYTSNGGKLLSSGKIPSNNTGINKILGSERSIFASLFDYYQEQNANAISSARKKDILDTGGDPDSANSYWNMNSLNFDFKINGEDYRVTWGNHTPILYGEFIDVIASSFIDQGDRPDGDFESDYFVQRDPKAEGSLALTVEEWINLKWPNNLISKNMETIIRPGRPIANVGTKMQVVIIAIAVPDYATFFSSIGTMAIFFGSFLESMWNGMKMTVAKLTPFLYDNLIELKREKRREFKKEIKENEAVIKENEVKLNNSSLPAADKQKLQTENTRLRQEVANYEKKIQTLSAEIIKLQKEKENESSNYFTLTSQRMFGLMKDTASTVAEDFGFSERNADSDSANQDFLEKAERAKSADYITEGGQVPDFYGVSLNSLFRPLFLFLETLISKMTKFKKQELTLTKQLQQILDEIEKDLRDLEAIVELLEKIIQQIEALLALNISILKITSTQGNLDIYEKIINSKGFPSEEVLVPMYHFGFAMAYVEPDFSNSEVLQAAGAKDLKKYFKSTKAEFDAETGEIVADAKDGIASIEQVLGIKK